VQKSDYADKPKMDKLSKETTVANAIFGGFYRSQVKCLHCNHESNTFDPMMDLNIDIKDCSNIMQGLQRSVRPDRLDGENKYFCEKCRTKRVAQKRGNIHKEPNVLTLQLKRFDFTRMFGGKVCKEISFPEKLNIRPFMSQSQGEPVGYQLYGVLVHSGFSCNSGHYYCYVRAANGTWYEMNDNRVAQVGLQTVLRAQAYILFYLKNKSTPSTATVPPVATKSSVSSTKDSQVRSNVDQKVPVKKSTDVPVLDTSIPVIGVKVGSSQNLAKKPDVRLASGSSTADATPIPKKKPKINWTQNNIHTVQSEKTSEIVKMPSNPLGPDPQPPVVKDNKVALNGLQALSQSYGDSDTGDSRESSPPAQPRLKSQMPPTPRPSTSSEEPISQPSINISNSIHQNEMNKNESKGLLYPLVKNEHKDDNADAQISKPFKLKLKDGKQFIHTKFKPWSPITKGTLYPRAILNKLNNESEQSKNQ